MSNLIQLYTTKVEHVQFGVLVVKLPLSHSYIREIIKNHIMLYNLIALTHFQYQGQGHSNIDCTAHCYTVHRKLADMVFEVGY